MFEGWPKNKMLTFTHSDSYTDYTYRRGEGTKIRFRCEPHIAHLMVELANGERAYWTLEGTVNGEYWGHLENGNAISVAQALETFGEYPLTRPTPEQACADVIRMATEWVNGRAVKLAGWNFGGNNHPYEWRSHAEVIAQIERPESL